MKYFIALTVIIVLLGFTPCKAHDWTLSSRYYQTITNQLSMRYSIVRGNYEIYRQELASANIIQDRHIPGKFYISTNSLSVLLYYLMLLPDNGFQTFLTFAFPFSLSNIKFGGSIYRDKLKLFGGITTDYYLFNTISRVYSAGHLSLEWNSSEYFGGATFEIPFSKGYWPDRTPHLGLYVGYLLK